MKILVISLAGIGDTLFATPLIHELRANFPRAVIHALVMWPGSRDLLENNPHLNRVFQKNLILCGRVEAFKFLTSLRRERYDVSINTYPQSRSHYRIAAHIIGANTRFSHVYECSGIFDSLLVNRTLPQSYFLHAVENNLAALDFLGAQKKVSKPSLEIFLTPAEKKWAEDFLAEKKLSGQKWLGIHVGSGGTKNLALRRWPLENFIELTRRLLGEKKLPVLFFGGPEEKTAHEKIQATLPQAIFPPTKNLRQAAALLAHASAFVSVDTALMHLAAAMKVPGQIVIETPTWNKPIEPFGNPFTLVENPAVAGRNLEFYRYDGGDIKGTNEELVELMKSVKVEDVLAAVTKAI